VVNVEQVFLRILKDKVEGLFPVSPSQVLLSSSVSDAFQDLSLLFFLSDIYPAVKSNVTSGIRTMELQSAFLHVWELMSKYSDQNKIR